MVDRFQGFLDALLQRAVFLSVDNLSDQHVAGVQEIDERLDESRDVNRGDNKEVACCVIPDSPTSAERRRWLRECHRQLRRGRGGRRSRRYRGRSNW